MPESLSSDLLLSLYKIAVEEYRFEVTLNWDRTAYYLTLNSGLVAVAAGLLKNRKCSNREPRCRERFPDRSSDLADWHEEYFGGA